MKKRIAAVILSMVLGAGMLAGCGQKKYDRCRCVFNYRSQCGCRKSRQCSDRQQMRKYADANVLEDGTYSVNVELSGGTWQQQTVDFPGNCDCDRWSGDG